MTTYSQETETVLSICTAPLMKSVLMTKTWNSISYLPKMFIRKVREKRK